MGAREAFEVVGVRVNFMDFPPPSVFLTLYLRNWRRQGGILRIYGDSVKIHQPGGGWCLCIGYGASGHDCQSQEKENGSHHGVRSVARINRSTAIVLQGGNVYFGSEWSATMQATAGAKFARSNIRKVESDKRRGEDGSFQYAEL